MHSEQREGLKTAVPRAELLPYSTVCNLAEHVPHLLLVLPSPGQAIRSTPAALQTPTAVREDLGRALSLLLNHICSPMSPSVRLALTHDDFDLPNCAAGSLAGPSLPAEGH